MCGIIYAQSLKNEPVNDLVLEQYENQHNRGKEGFGVAYLDEQQQMKVARATEPLKFMLDLNEKFRGPSSLILAHHRFPTSSPNLTGQTHPILVSQTEFKYDYLIVHNGVIGNADERRKAHEALGLSYSTVIKYAQTEKFNDSESLALDLALYMEDMSDKIEAKGSAAYVGLRLEKDTQKPLELFFGRNFGNPLHFSRDQKLIMLSSEGKGEEVEPETITLIDLTTLKQKTWKLEIASNYVHIVSPQPASSLIKTLPTATPTQVTENYTYDTYDSYDKDGELKPEEEEFQDSPALTRLTEIEDQMELGIQMFCDSLASIDTIIEAEYYKDELIDLMTKSIKEIEVLHTTAENARIDAIIDGKA